MFNYLLGKKKFIIGDFEEVISFLLRKISRQEKSSVVLPCSLHDLALDKNSLYENVDFYTSDSMLLTYFFRFKLSSKIDRVYGPDLMLEILKRENVGLSKHKHYFLAPNKKTANKLLDLLKNRYGNLRVICDDLSKGVSHLHEKNKLQEIIKAKPDFIWLGIGTPKQIELSSYIKSHSKNGKILCVGAAFEFVTEQKKQAPLLLQNYGLEWMFRLLTEPKRLWRRYLFTIPKFLLLSFWRKATHRKK